MARRNLVGLLFSFVFVLVVTVVHLVIFTVFLGSDESECAVSDNCPSWMIPNNAWIYLLLAILQLGGMLAALSFIFFPYTMARADGAYADNIPINKAASSFGTSGIFGLWILSSILSIATTRGYDSQYTDNVEYRMYLAAVVIFIVFDMLYIWLVAGINQIYINTSAAAANVVNARKLFRFATSIVAIRLTISIVFLLVQFLIDYTLGSDPTNNDVPLTLSSFGGYLMIILMLLYKIYLVQLLVRKTAIPEQDLFLNTPATYLVTDYGPHQN